VLRVIHQAGHAVSRSLGARERRCLPPRRSALADHNILITALHSHLLTEQPRLYFMHFWGLGNTESMAQGIKAALNKVHTK